MSASGAARTIHSFPSNDGHFPAGPPAEINGELYGLTSAGGPNTAAMCTQYSDGCGTVYKIGRLGVETTLFSWTDGEAGPTNLTALNGMLYGSISGYIFKVTTTGVESPFFATGGNVCSLTSAAGAMYGISCESHGHYHQIFKLLPSAAAVILHTFKSDPGFVSLSVVGSTVYGLTSRGGTYNKGTIFKIPL